MAPFCYNFCVTGLVISTQFSHISLGLSLLLYIQNWLSDTKGLPSSHIYWEGRTWWRKSANNQISQMDAQLDEQGSTEMRRFPELRTTLVRLLVRVCATNNLSYEMQPRRHTVH